MRCSKTYPVDMKDLLDLEKKIVPNKTEVKCLLACAYKMQGTVSIPFFIYNTNLKNKAHNNDKKDKPNIKVRVQ